MQESKSDSFAGVKEMTTKSITQIKEGCGKKFCEDCGSYNAEEEGHNLGCSEGDLGIVYCGTRDLEEELKLCPVCQAQLFAKQEIVEEINKTKEVGCVGMNEDFIKGSNWCNRLWLKKLEELKSKIEGEGK